MDIGSRRELFVDDALISRTTGNVRLVLHKPQRREVVMTLDKPWEGNVSSVGSVFRDGDMFRMYYRGWHATKIGENPKTPPVVCCAVSKDGIHWERPVYNHIEFKGSKKNNIVLPFSLIMSVFKDTNPDCPPDELYKGVSYEKVGNDVRRILKGFTSADGIHWKLVHNDSIITKGVTRRAFDTCNVAFWDPNIGKYRAYIRDWHKEGNIRGIKTATSGDFRNWSVARWLKFDRPCAKEHLYTSAARVYARAPHIYIGFPTRYLPQRDSITEPLFMSSRDGVRFKLWNETVIRPGRNRDLWNNRGNYIWYSLIETKSDLPGNPPELSLYTGEGYYEGTSIDFRRYTYRPDGFVSLRADAKGGSMLTKPFTFKGDTLRLNVSTSASGSVRVEMRDRANKPMKGFTRADCPEVYCDDIDRRVQWKGGSDLGRLAGKPVRMFITLKDADLYAFRFADEKQ